MRRSFSWASGNSIKKSVCISKNTILKKISASEKCIACSCFLLLIHDKESILFWGQIFEIELFFFNHYMFWIPPPLPESKNQALSDWSTCLSVCLHVVRVCMSTSVNGTIQKQTAGERSSLVFSIYILYKCYYETFFKIRLQPAYKDSQMNSNTVL